MVSLTAQVRVRAAVEELTTTPNTESVSGTTVDSISTSKEQRGTGGGEERIWGERCKGRGKEWKVERGGKAAQRYQKVSFVPHTRYRMTYWSLPLFPSPPESLQCLSFHCR